MKNIKFNSDLIGNTNCNITYSGKLFQDNAGEVTLVYGFGDNWANTTETLMVKTETGFTAEIGVLDYDKLNFCFKNSNSEWDNNNSSNYVEPILPSTPIAPTSTATGSSSTTASSPSPSANEDASTTDGLTSDTETSTSDSIKEFDIDALIDELLNPLITFKSEPVAEATELLTVDRITSSTPVEDTEDTSVPANPNAGTFLISPRKLGTFYMLRKKIMLAIRKAFVTLPKILTGDYETDENK